MWGARPPTPDAELWGGVAQSSTRKHKDGLGATPENQRDCSLWSIMMAVGPKTRIMGGGG